MKTTIYTLTTESNDDRSTQAYTSAKECDADAAEFMQRYPDSYCDTAQHELDLPDPPGYAELLAALQFCVQQIEQMQGMFPDDDGQIQEALDDAYAAMKQAKVAQPAPLKVVIEVSGGVADVTICPDGVEVEIVDLDNACPKCGAVEGTPEWGTVGDGYNGCCPTCADNVTEG